MDPGRYEGPPEGLGQRILDGIKAIALAVAGLALFVVFIGLGAVCTFSRAEVRPYLPPVVRSILTNPDEKFEIDTYLNDVDDTLNKMLEDSDTCRANRDQPCLTAALERGWKGVGEGIPLEASWMSGAHGRLRNALHAMWQLNLRSETEPITDEFIADTEAAGAELGDAVEEWYRKADQGD